MKKPASVHIDIAEFSMTVMELSETDRGSWLLSLAKCLSYADPSLNTYGAKLLSEVNEYRESERIRKERYKEKPEVNGKTRKDTERHGKTVFPLTEQTEQTEQTDIKKVSKDTKKDKPDGLLDVYYEFIILGLEPSKAKIKAVDFYSFYNSNGWKVGKSPMKDWRSACAGTWMKEFKRATDFEKAHLKDVVEVLKEVYRNENDFDSYDIQKAKNINPLLFEDPFQFPDSWQSVLGGLK